MTGLPGLLSRSTAVARRRVIRTGTVLGGRCCASMDNSIAIAGTAPRGTRRVDFSGN